MEHAALKAMDKVAQPHGPVGFELVLNVRGGSALEGVRNGHQPV